eukprot:844464_1
MPSSQSSLPRNSKGRFRKGTDDPRRYRYKTNPPTPNQRKKKRKLDLRRSQRIKHQTQRKKKRKRDLTPPEPFHLNKKGLRRSRRIKRQKQEAKSLRKAKRIKRRKRKQQKSKVKDKNKKTTNAKSKVKKPLSKAQLMNIEYRCVQCNQRFPIDVKHYCSHDPLTIEHFVCFDSECDFKFDCFDAFKEHMNKCHRLFRNLYKCPHCSKRYDAKCQLKNHENDHLNNARFECCLCKQRFTMLFKLRGHQCVGMDPQL